MTRADRIRDIVERRGIEHLIHFTRASNLPSIMRHGIMPLDGLRDAGVAAKVNDTLRLEGRHDAVCLSVSHPNEIMLAKYRARSTYDRFVVLAINPKVLWERNCSFYPVNAASKIFEGIPIRDLSDPGTLEDMFADPLLGRPRNPDLAPDFPTDVQAEILVSGTIPASDIVGAVFDNHRVLYRFHDQVRHIPTLVDMDGSLSFGERLTILRDRMPRPAAPLP